MSKYKVAFADAPNADNSVTAARQVIELAGGLDIRDASVVTIKPNLTSSKKSADSGVTTHVGVVEGVVQYINLVARGCQIRIVESDSDGPAEEAFQRLGYVDMAERYENVKLINLSQQSRMIKILPKDPVGILRSVAFPEILLETDYFINIANLKRHTNERMTGIWKNVYGLPADHLTRIKYHPVLSAVLYDLNRIFWPDFAMIDAIIGHEGAGPIDGNPVSVGKVFGGKDALAVDVIAAKMMGENPRRVPHLRYALRRMPRPEQEIEIVGEMGDALPFSFVPELGYRLTRMGMFARRLALYSEHFGLLLSIGGAALRVGGPSDFMGGKLQSARTSFKLAWELTFRFDLSERYVG